MRISDWSSDVCSSDLAARRLYSIIMKAIWLARRDAWSRLITPISGTRAVFTLGARSHQSNLAQPKGKRSEERRVGNEWVSTCSFRWTQYHSKTKTKYTYNEHRHTNNSTHIERR